MTVFRKPLVPRTLSALALGATLVLPTTLLLPGCSGGSGSLSGSNSPSVTQNLAGTVPLGTGQNGALALEILSDNTARGRLTVSSTTAQVQIAQTATLFAPGVYNVVGSRNSSGVYNLSGTVSGRTFTLAVTLPSSNVAGSFTVTLDGVNYGPATLAPVTSPTAAPTTAPTTGPTTAPTPSVTPGVTPGVTPSPSGRVPFGTSSSANINLTSTNTSLSNGNLSASGAAATVVVDQLGTNQRITLTGATLSLPPAQFSAQLVKTGGTFGVNDPLTIVGESGTTDLVTLLVANVSNPLNSGTFRGRGGTFRITSISGRTVNYTISNLRMVSLINGSSFNYNGSGSFTIQ